MFETLTQRRYLVPLKASRLPQQFCDVLVIGGGIAGLRAAIAASAEKVDVVLLAKDSIEESNTWYAQGGIAAVLQPEDSYASHAEDTQVGGAGLCSQRVVDLVVSEGPQRVLELLQWGAHFDRDEARAYGLAVAREGGHSQARILHAQGDATGKELAQTLIRVAQQLENIRVVEKSFAIDLITHEGACVGTVATLEGKLSILWARKTILATGGAGQLFRETTNPKIATADGHAMAWRAGATLADMEMVQFHPTTLYVAGASRALVTEAVRGEGAYLVDRAGHRFMPDYHEQAELAPRDVVSRAIVQQIRKTAHTHVYLDVRHLPTAAFRARFPQLARLCDEFEINIGKDLIPIHPAAHYMIGGVEADMQGRTTLPGLYAVGEAACTGLHGANRLGSNSLLEGLTFGARAGADAARAALEVKPEFPLQLEHKITPATRTELDVVDVKSSLRSLMWRNVGIERSAQRLAETREIIDFWSRYVIDKTFLPGDLPACIAGWELQNMLSIASLITSAAYTRTESRGAHHRLDHPQRDDQHWRVRLLWRRPLEMPFPRGIE